MRVLAVVCARKGSKRLKNKNRLEIGWRPMYAYPILAAVNSYVTHVVVSTDDHEILEWVKRDPAAVGIKRPESLATDAASIHWALVHAAAAHEVEMGCKYDAVACLLANVPTVTPETINGCIAKLEKNKKATAVVAVRRACCPIEWQYVHRKGGRYVKRTLFGRGGSKFRMQDLPTRYIATGSCCIVRRETLMLCQDDAAHAWLGEKIEPYMEEGPTIEVDTVQDYQLAKAWLERDNR